MYDKAVRINPNDAMTYTNKGFNTYLKSRDSFKSIRTIL